MKRKIEIPQKGQSQDHGSGYSEYSDQNLGMNMAPDKREYQVLLFLISPRKPRLWVLIRHF